MSPDILPAAQPKSKPVEFNELRGSFTSYVPGMRCAKSSLSPQSSGLLRSQWRDYLPNSSQSEPGDNVPALIDGRRQRNGSNKQKRYTIAYFMRCAGNFPISQNSIVQICILPANGRPSRRRASEKLKFAIYCVWLFERVAVNGKREETSAVAVSIAIRPAM